MSEQAVPIIDPVRPSDREAIAELFAADLRSLRIGVPSDGLLAVIDRIIADEGRSSLLWAAREEPGGRPVGVVFATLFFSIKHAGRALWLEQLYVDPTGRRGGVGRALVQRVLEWSRDNGIAGIDLESYQLNAPASCLYRSLGFRRLGRERFTIDLQDTKTIP